MTSIRERWQRRMGGRPREPEPPPPPAGGQGMTDESGIPTVPYVPVRCPNCRAGKPITDGRYEAKMRRYHTCQVCGLEFRSVELDPFELR